MRRPVFTARRTALAAGVVLLVVVGGWAVRAALVGSRTTAAPVVAADPPASRTRREAAIALATMPDDPWTFAESLAASAPASGGQVSNDQVRCGDNERPRFADAQVRNGEVTADQTAAAGPHYLAARARMDAVLRSSADPLDRAVADALDVGQMRTPSGRVDALVEQAIATSDARVYALAFRTCRGGAPAVASCAALNPRHWAELDPGNGVPWVYALSQARDANDAAGQQEALTRMASASRFDTYQFAPAAAVAAHLPENDEDLSATSDLAIQAVGPSISALPADSVFSACREGASGDASRAQQCEAVSDVMFDHTDSMFLRTLSGGLQFLATGDETRRQVARAELALAARTWSPATGFSPCQVARDTLKTLRRNGEVGEVEAAHERARVFVTP